MDLPGFDGIPPSGHLIPLDPDDPSKGYTNVTCGTAEYVCKGGPGYDTFAGKFPSVGGSPHVYPYSEQHDRYSALHGALPGNAAVKMFSPEQLPVKAALAREFGVFNKMYTAVPSASSPNHLFTQSATSCGMQHNGLCALPPAHTSCALWFACGLLLRRRAHARACAVLVPALRYPRPHP